MINKEDLRHFCFIVMINIIKFLRKNKYKFLVFVLILFFLAFLGMWNIVSGGYDKQNKTILFIKKFIPSKLAREVRDTIFIIPDLKERNRYLELVMKKYDQGMNGEIFNEKIIISEKNKNKYLFKEFFIPFSRLDLRLGWASSKNSLKKHYLEIIEDKVLVISGNGQTIYFNKNNIFNKKLDQVNIPNNLKKILNLSKIELNGIRDLFVEENKVFISLYFKNSKGFSMNVYVADLNYTKLNFSLFFESNQYWNQWSTRTGGRIEKYVDNKILLSIGDGSTKNSPQNLKSLLGKIISIDKETKEYEIISFGHRNPQGLVYIEDLKLIINTEHGPKGGDEININYLDSAEPLNYGWDISSYGTEYSGDDPYKKSHSEYGFIEPFKNYTPSIGISEIAYIPNNLGDEKLFFVSSLRAGSIYTLKTDNKISKILDEDRIFFPEQRIRDIEYDKENDIFFLIFDPIPSIGILKLI